MCSQVQTALLCSAWRGGQSAGSGMRCLRVYVQAGLTPDNFGLDPVWNSEMRSRRTGARARGQERRPREESSEEPRWEKAFSIQAFVHL